MRSVIDLRNYTRHLLWLDLQLLRLLTFRAGRWPMIDGGLITCARRGSYAEVALMTFVGLRYGKGGRRAARRCLVGAVALYGQVQVIGLCIGRVRPFASEAPTPALVGHDVDRSFPSRHVASAVAMAETVRLVAPGAASLMYSVAVALGLGRIRAGLHYPSDVLGGALLGYGMGRMLRVSREIRWAVRRNSFDRPCPASQD